MKGINEIGFDGITGLEMLIEQRYDYDDDGLLLPCILLLIEAGAKLNENRVCDDLFSAILNRIIEIAFLQNTILEKWTGRIAKIIIDFTIGLFTKTSLENLSNFLD